jgi:hypothetical protein
MLILKESITNYLGSILGLTNLTLIDYPKAKQLPYLLQDEFAFLQMELGRHLVTLAMPKKDTPLRQIRTALTHMPKDELLVLCFESLASYERRYLIEQKISFLVPGNQLYLMELGIDLREYFHRQRKAPVLALNPASQAMLLWFLQTQPLASEWSPSEIAATLQYSNMTASRAVAELVELGLFEEFSLGRRKYLRSNDGHAVVWQKAKPYLRSPVKFEIWTHSPVFLRASEICLAGVSALSKLTMVNADQETCYALSPAQWRANQANITVLPEKEPGATCYQIWAYEPRMQRSKQASSYGTPCVDLLSLWLSFRDSGDARIELALSDLEREFRW